MSDKLSLDKRVAARLETERALLEGLRLGLVTRTTNLFMTMSTGAATSTAPDNFENGIKLAIKNYDLGQAIIHRCVQESKA